MFSHNFASLSVLFFFLYRSPSSSSTVFDSISSNIDEVLSMILSAGVFVFGDFNWLTYSDGTDKSGELSYNFSISNNSNFSYSDG